MHMEKSLSKYILRGLPGTAGKAGKGEEGGSIDAGRGR